LLFRENIPKKIAIYRFGSFGDSIITFPAIKAIRKYYPNAKIHIYNKPESDNLIKMENLLDENMYDKIITLKANSSIKELYYMIKKENYDIWFELSSAGLSFSKALQKVVFLKLAGVKYVNGMEITPNKFLSKYFKNNYNFISERERLLKNISRIGINTQKYSLDFPLKDMSENMENVKKCLLKDNIDKNKLIVLITKSKRDSTTWAQKNWIELSKKLLNKGYQLAFIGAPSDSGFINSIVNELNSNYVQSYAGDFTVMDSAALLKLSTLAISVDTGPMHLAYALGTKVISLFSARDYMEKWYPPKELGVVIRTDLECSPCFLDVCPKQNECMDNIKIKDILNEL
jgi:ADP-heptose:LPS heptosyltransferase